MGGKKYTSGEVQEEERERYDDHADTEKSTTKINQLIKMLVEVPFQPTKKTKEPFSKLRQFSLRLILSTIASQKSQAFRLNLLRTTRSSVIQDLNLRGQKRKAQVDIRKGDQGVGSTGRVRERESREESVLSSNLNTKEIPPRAPWEDLTEATAGGGGGSWPPGAGFPLGIVACGYFQAAALEGRWLKGEPYTRRQPTRGESI